MPRAGLLTCADSSCPAGGAALPLRMRSARRVRRGELEAGAAFPGWLWLTWYCRRPPVTARSDTAVARAPRPKPVAERGAEREAAGSEVSAARGRPGGPRGWASGSPGAARAPQRCPAAPSVPMSCYPGPPACPGHLFPAATGGCGTRVLPGRPCTLAIPDQWRPVLVLGGTRWGVWLREWL